MANGVRDLLTATGVIIVLVTSGSAPAAQVRQGDLELSGSETQTIEGTIDRSATSTFFSDTPIALRATG